MLIVYFQPLAHKPAKRQPDEIPCKPLVGWTMLLNHGAIIKGVPQMVMGTGLVKQHSGLKESSEREVTGADRVEEVGGHWAERAEGRIRWRQRIDVKDGYGKATQSQPQEQLRS